MKKLLLLLLACSTITGWAASPTFSGVIVTGTADLNKIYVSGTALGAGSHIIYVSKSAQATDTRAGLNKSDVTRPFATLTAAQSAASSGDTIIVASGIYAEMNLGKDGVNWYFQPGSIISMLTDATDGSAIFRDNGTAMTFTVAGYGNFIIGYATDSGGTLYFHCISITDASSVITVYCENMTSTASAEGDCSTVFQQDGILVVRARNIDSLEGGTSYGVWWENGFQDVKASKINCENYFAVGGSCSFIPTGDCHVQAEEINGGVAEAGSNATAAIWIRANIIRGIGSQAGVANQGSNKLYVECQKVFGAVQCLGGILYFRGDKVQAISNGISAASAGMMFIHGGTAHITCSEYTPDTFTGQMLEQDGGTLYFKGGVYTAISGANGFNISSGTGYLKNGLRLDTSSSGTTSPITKSGGTLILDDVTMVSSGTQLSISATNAQNIKVYGAQANVAVSGTITQQVGTVIINSNVQ